MPLMLLHLSLPIYDSFDKLDSSSVLENYQYSIPTGAAEMLSDQAVYIDIFFFSFSFFLDKCKVRQGSVQIFKLNFPAQRQRRNFFELRLGGRLQFIGLELWRTKRQRVLNCYVHCCKSLPYLCLALELLQDHAELVESSFC